MMESGAALWACRTQLWQACNCCRLGKSSCALHASSGRAAIRLALREENGLCAAASWHTAELASPRRSLQPTPPCSGRAALGHGNPAHVRRQHIMHTALISGSAAALLILLKGCRLAKGSCCFVHTGAGQLRSWFKCSLPHAAMPNICPREWLCPAHVPRWTVAMAPCCSVRDACSVFAPLNHVREA